MPFTDLEEEIKAEVQTEVATKITTTSLIPSFGSDTYHNGQFDYLSIPLNDDVLNMLYSVSNLSTLNNSSYNLTVYGHPTNSTGLKIAGVLTLSASGPISTDHYIFSLQFVNGSNSQVSSTQTVFSKGTIQDMITANNEGQDFSHTFDDVTNQFFLDMLGVPSDINICNITVMGVVGSSLTIQYQCGTV